MNGVIPGSYSPRYLRSPYADSTESLDPPIHAVVWNRSGIQRTRLGAPDSRIVRSIQAADAADSDARTYLGLTRSPRPATERRGA